MSERYVVQVHRVTRTADAVRMWPFRPGTREETIEVYRQDLEELDLRAVIAAVNGNGKAKA